MRSIKKTKRQVREITNIEEMRSHAIETLQLLGDGEIDSVEAGVTGKLYEGVVASVKLELEYSKMLGATPNIPFLGNATPVIEHAKTPALLQRSKID